MDGKIQYLNTDLDLIGPGPPTPLVEALTRQQKLFSLGDPIEGKDGQWFSRFEIKVDFEVDEPEITIRVMLDAIERVLASEKDAAAAALWWQCSLREFNIGYDCGDEPWAFNQGLSNDTLRRLAACGGTLRITIYPDRG